MNFVSRHTTEIHFKEDMLLKRTKNRIEKKTPIFRALNHLTSHDTIVIPQVSLMDQCLSCNEDKSAIFDQQNTMKRKL